MAEETKLSIEEPPAKPKEQWQDPTFTSLGNVTELVQAAGKSGANADADPGSTTKPGAG